MRFATIIFVTLLAAMPAFSQQPTFGERVDVNVVLIDAVVTDSRGNQILGLTEEDFVVTENGVPQTIDSIDYFTTRRLLDTPEENAPFQVERVHEERYLIFFFDKPIGGELFERLVQARRAAAEFIDRDMGANDLVAIAGHDVRLKVYSDFTADKKQLKKALDEAARFGRGLSRSNSPEGKPSILRNLSKSEMMDRTGTVYEALEALADAVRPIRARKNLVLFSPGIHEPGEEVRGGVLLNTSRYYDPMVEALNAANVTVYAANLIANPPADPIFHQTLERLTADTNGEYYRYAISFRPVVKEVEKASGGYYLITYRTQKPKGKEGFQKVDVTVKNPEFRVKARAGYLYGG